ncbi:MAG: hypothetical protein H7833_08380 [Magnetococcus sp. DMHC-1]|nr:hypothetical protein [Magnetococcales bacterium]
MNDSSPTAAQRFQDHPARLRQEEAATKACNQGRMFIQQQRYQEAMTCLLQAMELHPSLAAAYEGMAQIFTYKGLTVLGSVYERLFQHYAGQPAPLAQVEHTFFIDPALARRTAHLGQRIILHKAYSVPQLCYTLGKPLPEDLPTVIALLPDQTGRFLATTRLHFPRRVEFDPQRTEQVQMAVHTAKTIESAMQQRIAWIEDARQRCLNEAPVFDEHGPLRIFMPTSRSTTVMQFATNNLARALLKLGCQVRVHIEQDDREWDDDYSRLQDYEACKPHVIININHLFNDWLHPDVINVTWWQDPMLEISRGDPLPWRSRDLVYSAYPNFDDYLKKTGATQVMRQDLCVDLDVFHPEIPWEERRKVVFIGTSYAELLPSQLPEKQTIIDLLRPRFLRGEMISFATLDDYSRKTGLNTLAIESIYCDLLRNTAIEWLCQMAHEIDLEVEIYGRYWERNEHVRPFYKGELRHGPDVAAVYNQARYALAVHPFMVKSQRLAEIAACGCVPVLMDDRANAEPPHWDDAILFFRTRDELKSCLRQRPPQDSRIIAEACSYDRFARHILNRVTSILKQPVAESTS